jgi:hypothetical protein
MKTAHELFNDIDRLGEQIAIQIDSLDESRKELDQVINSHPGRDVLGKISARLDSTASSLRELCQTLWFKAAGLRRLIGGGEETS